MTNTTIETVRKIKPAQLKKWARANRSLAESVLRARAFVELERARVSAYINPIFARYGFRDEDTGELLTDERRSYLAGEDSRFTAYYAECDAAHRAHGFTGEPGECPALCAEELVRLTEQALLDSMGQLSGIDGHGFNLTLELRAKALDWALNVCAMSLA